VRALRCRGGALSQRTRWERSAPHRVRRGVFVGAGGRIGPCSCRAPIRRARRARSRAWACLASASCRPPHREGRAGVGRERPRACALGAVSALTPAPRTRRAILASAGGSRAPRAPPAPSQRAQRARAEARRRASRGSGALRGPPRCRATPAQGHRRSTCTPGREEGLYVVLRPAQSRPTRPARTWLACSGHSSWRRPPRGWRSAAHTASSTQVACLASGGALLGAKTHPVTPRMLGARVVGVLGRPAGA
jgi:hypothetical protein